DRAPLALAQRTLQIAVQHVGNEYRLVSGKSFRDLAPEAHHRHGRYGFLYRIRIQCAAVGTTLRRRFAADLVVAEAHVKQAIAALVMAGLYEIHMRRDVAGDIREMAVVM